MALPGRCHPIAAGIEALPAGLLDPPAAGAQVAVGLHRQSLLHHLQRGVQQPCQPRAEPPVGIQLRLAVDRDRQRLVIRIAVERLHAAEDPLRQGQHPPVEPLGRQAMVARLQTGIALEIAEQRLDRRPHGPGEAVLQTQRQHHHPLAAAGAGQIVGGPEGQLRHARLQGAHHLVVAVGGSLRRHGERIGTIEQQRAGGAQRRQIEAPPLDRAAPQVRQHPAGRLAGPQRNAAVVEELGMGPGAKPVGARQVVPEQLRQHRRILNGGMAKGEQQAAAALLEGMHLLREPLKPLHAHRLDAAASQPQGHEQPRRRQHAPIESRREEGQGGAGGHGRCSAGEGGPVGQGHPGGAAGPRSRIGPPRRATRWRRLHQPRPPEASSGAPGIPDDTPQ